MLIKLIFLHHYYPIIFSPFRDHLHIFVCLSSPSFSSTVYFQSCQMSIHISHIFPSVVEPSLCYNINHIIMVISKSSPDVSSLAHTGTVSLDVSITPGSGMFEVCESGTLVVSGRVFQPSEPIIDLPLCDPVEAPQDAHLIRLTSSDVYKQLRLRGYDYGPTFQGILSASNKGKAVVFREG